MLISFYKQILQILALMDIMSNVPLPNNRLGYADWDLCLCSALYPSCSVNVPSIFYLSMFCLCSVYVPYVSFSQCSFFVPFMFRLSSVYVPSTVYILALFRVCSCYVPSTFLLFPAMFQPCLSSGYGPSTLSLCSAYILTMFPLCSLAVLNPGMVCLVSVCQLYSVFSVVAVLKRSGFWYFGSHILTSCILIFCVLYSLFCKLSLVFWYSVFCIVTIWVLIFCAVISGFCV